MLLRCAVILFCLNVVRTSEGIYSGLSRDAIRDIDARFSSWPTTHDGFRLMRIRKREAEDSKVATSTTTTTTTTTLKPAPAVSSDQVAKPVPPSVAPPASPPASVPSEPVTKNDSKDEKPKSDDKVPVITGQNNTSTGNSTEAKAENNATATKVPPKINLSDPGVIKRAFIVFGGFALLGTAYYFIVYRKKNNANDVKNMHSSIDPNQFRYGVLKSDDKMNNIELSRVPLTMESDEDDEEDLEIFDLGQKKKSLSYINLQQHDDDIVFNDSRSADMENLLVDIEDKNSDTLINWSSTGSKSIL